MTKNKMLYADLYSKEKKVLMAKMGGRNWSIGVSGCDLRLLIQILHGAGTRSVLK